MSDWIRVTSVLPNGRTAPRLVNLDFSPEIQPYKSTLIPNANTKITLDYKAKSKKKQQPNENPLRNSEEKDENLVTHVYATETFESLSSLLISDEDVASIHN